MYRWAKDDLSSVIRLSDGACIPCVAGNADFHDFELWRAAGNTPEPVSIPQLATVKAEGKARVSAAAETARHQYITPGSGKAMSYQEVAAEAKRHLATGGEGAYPFLQARVDSGRYANLTAARDGTLALEAQWAVVGAAIDKAEDQAKLAIDAATTVDQVRVAEQVTWP